MASPQRDPLWTAGARRATRALSLALIAVGIAGCNSLSEEELNRLNTFKQNSKRFYESQQFRRAEVACLKGLEIDEEDQSLHQVLGFSLLRQGKPSQVHQSIQIFERAIDCEKDFDFRTRLGLGESYLQMGLLRQGQRAAFEADEKLTPEEREAKLMIVDEEMKRCFEESEIALRAVLDSPRGRDSVAARSALSRLYATVNRYDDAALELRAMVSTLSRSINLMEEQVSTTSLDPDRLKLHQALIQQLSDQQVEALLLLSVVAAKQKRWDEVISAYAQLEAMDKMQPADYFNRAKAYEALDARDPAISDYETFVRRAASLGAAFIEPVGIAMDRQAALENGEPTRKTW